MVQKLNENNFKSSLLDNQIVVIKFSTDWCAPCKALAPKYNELSERVPVHVTMCEVDADAEPDICDMFGIRSVPTIIVFENGDMKETFVNPTIDEVEEFILKL